MENVIYSKFSCERKKQFQIVTKITEENNIRHIRKQALNKAGYEHIGTLVEKMNRLADSESCRNVSIVKAWQVDSGTVELEYIHGTAFDEIVSDAAKNKNTDELIKTIKDFFELFEVNTRFEYTEGFKEVFGDISLNGEYMCMDVSNTDLLFGNVILRENKYYLSDYEWVFDFPVPFKYIIFRSIAFNAAISQLECESIDEIYKSFNISRNELDIFHKMEISFQNYVSGIKALEDYKKKNEIAALPVNSINIRKNVYYVQLVSGGAVTETKHFFREAFTAEFCMDNIKDNNIAVRFKNGQSIIKIEKITAYKAKHAYTPQYKANDAFHINDDYYFKSDYPEIIIENDGIERLEVKALVYYANTDLVGQYIDKIFEANEINSRLNALNDSLIMANGDKEELMRINDSYRQEINYLHSKAWFKFYFKLKAFKDKLLKTK